MSGSALPRRQTPHGTQGVFASGNHLPQVKTPPQPISSAPAETLAADQARHDTHRSAVGGINFDPGHSSSDAQQAGAGVVDLAHAQARYVAQTIIGVGSLVSGQVGGDAHRTAAAGNTLPPRQAHSRHPDGGRGAEHIFKETA